MSGGKRKTREEAENLLVEGTEVQFSRMQSLQNELEQMASTAPPTLKYTLLGVAYKLGQITRDTEGELTRFVDHICGKEPK